MVECECRSLLFGEGEGRGTEKGDGDGHWGNSDTATEMANNTEKIKNLLKVCYLAIKLV